MIGKAIIEFGRFSGATWSIPTDLEALNIAPYPADLLSLKVRENLSPNEKAPLSSPSEYKP